MLRLKTVLLSLEDLVLQALKPKKSNPQNIY
jgi:hypothetical protein